MIPRRPRVPAVQNTGRFTPPCQDTGWDDIIPSAVAGRNTSRCVLRQRRSVGFRLQPPWSAFNSIVAATSATLLIRLQPVCMFIGVRHDDRFVGAGVLHQLFQPRLYSSIRSHNRRTQPALHRRPLRGLRQRGSIESTGGNSSTGWFRIKSEKTLLWCGE